MSQMVERVARTLCLCAGYNPDQRVINLGKSDGKGLRWEFYVLAARYAIEALREPTSSMCSAANDDWLEVTPEDVWKAMIDEALR